MTSRPGFSGGGEEATTLDQSTLKNSLFLLVDLLAMAYPIYTLYLHPLSSYPDPKICALTRIPYWMAGLKGDQVKWMSKLHREYGPVVRFGPNDLSYTDGQAWRDIHQVPKGRRENGKDYKYHSRPVNGTLNILLESDPSRHAALRRVFAPAFSEKTLKAQESLFQKYADLLVARAGEAAEVDLTRLFNFTTFDIMAEFTFGEPLHLLENNEYSPWVEMVFNAVKVLPLMQIIEFYPLAKIIFNLVEPKTIAKMRFDHFNHTVTRVNKRLQDGSDRQDWFYLALASGILTVDEMHSNAELFMIAGTETTASLLTGLTYYLVKNPDKLRNLTEEIRGSFESRKEINFEVLAQLQYLNACLKEGLRVYPPGPIGFPCIIANGGAAVLGKWLPGGTHVSVHHYSTYRSPANFKNPDKFVPERWLGDPEYEDDNRDVHQPFSVGPRNCLGMNMAWHEMRLLLAMLVYEFDIESDVGPDWTDQKVYVIWDRKPLLCHMKPAASRGGQAGSSL
ncbi:cytochrome P450 [Xylariaceae sp. FL0594]|nr:cytochrome P450 [Xylariaceae sp. FL0594]